MSKSSGILVLIQFSCLAYFILATDFLVEGIGRLFQIAGFTLSLWGVATMKIGNFNIQPEVKKTAVFIQKGPYKLIRNPMYTGLIILIGTSIIYNQNIRDAVIFLLFVIILLLKINMEEKFLEDRFGEEYLNYKKNTFRLLPYLY